MSSPQSTTDVGASALAPDSEQLNSRRWLALAVIAIAQLMVVLDASIVNIALPTAKSDLHISTANQQWVITAYTLAFGGLLLLGGRISDYVGRKRMFIIGLIGFAAASALGGASVNQGMLFGSRALQGAFAAILAPAALSLITVTFTEARERARAFGVYGAIAGGGAAIGLILGGVLTEYASWRWCLLVNVPIAIITAIAAIPVVTESRAEGNARYDVPGTVLVVAGLVALVYGFTEAAKAGVGWLDPVTLAMLAAAVVLLSAFVYVESRSAHALLPLRVVTDRNRGASFFASLLVGAALFSMFLFLTLYFQVNLHYSPLKSGFAFLPFSGGIIVSAGVASSLIPRIGPKILMVGGSLLALLGLLWLTQITENTSWLSHVLPSEIVMSVGLGFIFVPLSSLALYGVSPHDAGVASALLNTTQQVGGSLGTALLNTLFASALASYLADHFATAQSPLTQANAAIHGYHIAFIVGAGMLFLAFVALSIFIKAGKQDLPSDAALPA